MTGDVNLVSGIRSFFVVTLGGAAFGLGIGYLFGKLTQHVNDPQIEITLATILAYSSYLLAEHLPVSGVIATVSAGLMTGNFGFGWQRPTVSSINNLGGTGQQRRRKLTGPSLWQSRGSRNESRLSSSIQLTGARTLRA